MKHLFVPYDIARQLKEKGFDEPCLGYWFTTKGKNPEIHSQLNFIGWVNNEDNHTTALQHHYTNRL